MLDTLRSLEAQRPPNGGFEVVVVDNGSSDGTSDAVEERIATSPLRLTLLAEPREGPSPARNTGLTAASGEIVLFLGDDTAPASTELLEAHASLHSASRDHRLAIQGRVTWRPDQPISHLMEWLEAGFQFDFEKLQAGPISVLGAFYTAHISLNRQLLMESGEFDPRLRYLEDLELGLRLERLGMRLQYHPELLVFHDHPTTLPISLSRMRDVGRSAVVFRQIHPDWDIPVVKSPTGLRWLLLRWTTPLWRLLAHLRLPRRATELVWRALHLSAYAEGYRRGPPRPDSGPA